MTECECKRPKPFADMKDGGFRCQTCKEKILPITSTRNELPHIIGTHGRTPWTPERWAYFCPYCDREELYFPQISKPVGTAQCEACRAISTGEEVQAVIDQTIRDYEERKKSPMSRTLSLCGDGTYRGSNQD